MSPGAWLARLLVRDMGGDQSLLEHGVKRGRDIGRRIGGEKEVRGRAALKAGRNVRDVSVGVDILTAGEGRVLRRDGLVWNIKYRDHDAAVLEWLAQCRRVQHGGMIAAGPAAAVDAFGLGILRAIGDEENIGQSIRRGGAI